MLITSVTVFSQTTLSGKVVDETNQPLPGASVTIKSSKIGATTDFDGNFTFDSSVNSGTLEVSFIGYESKLVAFNGKTNFGTVSLKPSAETLDEIVITQTSFAIDRKTPVAVSTITAAVIEEKLGNQEFPEILKSTPGVYATKTGGGYGDGRINLRGFSSQNVAVMINGAPVNDMENGAVYWSNWAGLGDVTSAMQVQRGLGASKVAVPSIGGTINVVTKTTDAQMGGNIVLATANDGYQKYGATLSTGLMDNGFAVTISAASITGDGYVDGTEFEGVNYFANISKIINDNHKLSFSAFGAKQNHGQRYNKRTIAGYRETESGAQKYNPDWGYSNGQVEYISYNYYNKPQMSLNHYWDLNEKTNISTAVYASFGSGGGRRSQGGKFADDNYRLGAADQPIDFDKISMENRDAGIIGASDILYNSVNSHSWYGILSTLKTDLSENLVLSGGIDGRYYVGSHYYAVDNLLGGEFFLNTDKSDNTYNQALKVGDKFGKDYDGKVLWGGLFGQLEYTKDELAVFFSTSVSNTTYSKEDFMKYASTDPDRESDKANFVGYSFKGGANYNIDDTNNVFANIGYFSKAPFLTGNVFQSDRSTELNPDALNEKVFSVELGYGFRGANFSANVNLYNTSWLDKSLTGSIPNPAQDQPRLVYNIPGLDALHQGIELDFRYNVTYDLTFTGMASLGNWRWTNDAKGRVLDEAGTVIENIDVYAKDLKVSDAAQTTFALGLDYKVLPKTSVYLDFNYADNIYAQYNITSRGNEADREDSWKMPAYGLFDLGLNHGFNIGSLDATLNARMNNIFDVEYISDAYDESGDTHSAEGALVYYGFGRTFSVGMKIKF